MTIINYKLDQLAEDFSKFVTKNSKEDINEEHLEKSVFEMFDFPINTIEELRKLDDHMKMDNNKIKLVRIVV